MDVNTFINVNSENNNYAERMKCSLYIAVYLYNTYRSALI